MHEYEKQSLDEWRRCRWRNVKRWLKLWAQFSGNFHDKRVVIRFVSSLLRSLSMGFCFVSPQLHGALTYSARVFPLGDGTVRRIQTQGTKLQDNDVIGCRPPNTIRTRVLATLLCSFRFIWQRALRPWFAITAWWYRKCDELEIVSHFFLHVFCLLYLPAIILCVYFFYSVDRILVYAMSAVLSEIHYIFRIATHFEHIAHAAKAATRKHSENSHRFALFGDALFSP